jgi:hypothetical protein
MFRSSGKFKKRNQGPELPFKLSKELQGAGDGDGHAVGRHGKRPMSRKNQRKAQRQDKKKRRDAFNQRQHLRADGQQGNKRSRGDAGLNDHRSAAKRQRGDQNQKSPSSQGLGDKHHVARTASPAAPASKHPRLDLSKGKPHTELSGSKNTGIMLQAVIALFYVTCALFRSFAMSCSGPAVLGCPSSSHAPAAASPAMAMAVQSASSRI